MGALIGSFGVLVIKIKNLAKTEDPSAGVSTTSKIFHICLNTQGPVRCRSALVKPRHHQTLSACCYASSLITCTHLLIVPDGSHFPA
jgi:hypothetical protein